MGGYWIITHVYIIKHISMFYLERGSDYIVKWISYMKMTVFFVFFFVFLFCLFVCLFVFFFEVLQICCRPTVTQLNMEFSNEKIKKQIKLMKS